MGILGEFTPRTNTDPLEAAAQLIETGQYPVGGANPETLLQHTANSLRNVVQLLADPAQATVFDLSAQDIESLQEAAKTLERFSNGQQPGAQYTDMADQLAAMRAPLESGDVVASKAGRAFLAGAETALRAISE